MVSEKGGEPTESGVWLRSPLFRKGSQAAPRAPLRLMVMNAKRDWFQTVRDKLQPHLASRV